MSKTYTIATGNIHSTKIAAEILDNGGNAYDAILAALFMSFVCEPLLSSPGGGGYMLAHAVNDSPKIFDFFAQTPIQKTALKKDFYPISGDFGNVQQEFHIGMASAAIPGIPAGIFAIHQKYGTMPLNEIAHGSITMASNGAIIDKIHADVIQILSPIINHSKQAKEVFTDDSGHFLKEFDKKANPKLAQFLSDFSTQPADWFYRERPAQDIIEDMRMHNGLLKRQDFDNYQVKIRQPLTATINNWNILTNAFPTTGGMLICEQLNHAYNSSNSDKDIKIIEALIHADNLKNNHDFQFSKGTSHMSVIDQSGNVASMTVSNGEGCGYMVPNCGFMLNNFLGEEDINTKGFFNFTENTRMASMMSPTIIEKDKTKIALGTGGSNRIKTAMFQVIWNIVAENKMLNHAIDQPRYHYENGVLDIERGIKKNIIDQLQSIYPRTNVWPQRSLYFGGINAVQQGEVNFAIGDSRRDGVGLVKHCL